MHVHALEFKLGTDPVGSTVHHSSTTTQPSCEGRARDWFAMLSIGSLSVGLLLVGLLLAGLLLVGPLLAVQCFHWSPVGRCWRSAVALRIGMRFVAVPLPPQLSPMNDRRFTRGSPARCAETARNE